MSQVPQRQVEDIRTRLLNQSLDREQERLSYQSQQASPFREASFTSQGVPTFERPDSGFFQSIGNRLTIGGEELRSVDAGILQSLAERGFSGGSFDLPAPYVNGNKLVVLNGNAVPAQDAPIEDVWNALSDVDRNVLESQGKGLDTLKYLRVNNGEDFAEWFQTNTQVTRAQQALAAYSQEHPVLSGVGAVATVGVNALTDPVVLASLALAPFTGGTSAGAAGAKTAATGGVKTALRQGAARVVRGVLDPASLATRETLSNGAQRALFTRYLITASGGAYGATYATTADVGAQKLSMDLGNGDPDYTWSILNTSLGLGVGAILTHFGTRGLFRDNKKSGTSILGLTEDGENSLAMLRLANREARRGRVEPLSVDDVVASDFVESTLSNLYNPTAVRQIAEDLVGTGRSIDDVDMVKVAEYMKDFPTVSELREFLKSPDLIPATKTRWRMLSDEVEDLADQLSQVSREDSTNINKLSRRLNTKANELNKLIADEFAPAQTDVGSRLRQLLQDQPLSTLPTEEAQIQQLGEILSRAKDEFKEDFRSRSLVSHIHSLGETKVGKTLLINLLAGGKMKTKASVASSDTAESLISRMAGLLDNKGLDNTEVLKNASGTAVRDVLSRNLRDEMDYKLPIKNEVKRLKSSGWSDRDLFEQVARHRVEKTPLHADLQDLADRLYRYYDDLGTRGVASGTFDTFYDDFFSFTVSCEGDMVAAEAAIRASYRKFYAPLYDVSDPNAAVNFNALRRAGYIDDNFQIKNNPDTGTPFFEELPTKVSQLEPDILREYSSRLDTSIEADAKAFFQKRAIQRNVTFDSDEMFATPVPKSNSINPRKSRVADQRIYLDKDVLDSGFISTDLRHNIDSYQRLAGYSINRDAAISELFGQRLRWDTLIKTLRRVADTDRSKEALEELIKRDAILGRKYRMNAEGAALASSINLFGAAAITGPVGVSIAATEIPMAYFRAIMPRRDMVQRVGTLLDSIPKTLNKEKLKQIGVLHEADMHESRFFSRIDDKLPEQADTKLVQGARGLSHASRIVLLERALTSHSRVVNYGLTFSKLHYIKNKLPKLLDIPQTTLSDAEFRGVARKVGIDVGELELLRNSGLTELGMVRAAQRAIEIDPKALKNDERLLKVAYDTEDDEVLELWKRLNNMALRDAETFTLRPTPSDVVVTKNPVANLLFSMTSFINGFYGTTLTRVGSSPYGLQLGFFSFLLASQVATNVFRDILYNGESVETIRGKWEEDPTRELARAVAMLPVQGPMSLIPIGLYAYGAQADPARAFEGSFSGATPSMLARAFQTVYKSAEDLVAGKELSEGTKRNLERSIPGYNSFILRLLEESATGFEADSDR